MTYMSFLVTIVGELCRYMVWCIDHTTLNNRQSEGMEWYQTSSSRHIVKKPVTIVLNGDFEKENLSCYIERFNCVVLLAGFLCSINTHHLTPNIVCLFSLYHNGEKL